MSKFFSVLKATVVGFGLLVAPALSAAAAELPKPTGDVVLTVTGKITNTNAPGKAEFDRAMLAKLGMSELKTSHSWGEGVSQFEGVLAGKLLDYVGATGAKIKAAAVNDYAIELESAELRKVPVLLATKMNGADLRLRDRGPIWIVYPRDAHRELNDAKFDARWAWQLKRLEIK